MASQPTISRFENSLDKHSVFNLCYPWVNRYGSTLSKRKLAITININATDDPTHDKQQLSMFNGFYSQFCTTQLLFHDGDTGGFITPIYCLATVIRADNGFSCTALVEAYYG